jgi:hypothetical protein
MQEKVALLKEEVPTQATIVTELVLPEEPLEESPSRNVDQAQKKPKRRYPRIRREGQIYHCTYPDCSRTYRSSVSMNLHIKLKHNGGTKR